MAYRILENGKLGPFIAGEPSAEVRAQFTVVDVTGGDWSDKPEAKIAEANASVEAKIKAGAYKPGQVGVAPVIKTRTPAVATPAARPAAPVQPQAQPPKGGE